MKSNLKWLAVAGGLSTAMVVAFTASATAAKTSGTPPSVLAMSQKLDNAQLTLDYAYLPENGYAVVYGDDNGKPSGVPLGSVELKAGDHRGVKIKLNSEPAKGSRVWVSLYSDKDNKPGFDRKGDASFWPNGVPNINQLTVQ